MIVKKKDKPCAGLKTLKYVNYRSFIYRFQNISESGISINNNYRNSWFTNFLCNKQLSHNKKGLLLYIVLFSIALVIFFTPISLYADKLTLTLDEAIGLGLKNSTTLKVKTLALYSAKAKLRAAKAAYYPAVSTTISWSHLFKQPKTPEMTVDIMGSTMTIPGSYAGPSDPISVTTSVSQSVYTFGKIKNSVKIAEEGVRLAELDLKEEKRKLVVKIRRAFYGYILAKEMKEVMEETLAHKKESYNVAVQRFKAGLVPDYEVLSAESDLESFRPQVISAENQVQYALLAVMDLLGIKETGSFEVELKGSLEPRFYKLDKDSLIQEALKYKYEVAQYKENLRLMRIQKELAEGENRPIIAAFMNYQLSSGYDSTTGENRYWGKNSWSGDLTCGASVQIPISAFFPWSKEKADAVEAQLNLKQRTMGFDSIESGIRLAIENLVLKLQEEKAKIASGKKAVELATKLYESSNERYSKGLVSRIEMRDAQIRLNNAKLAYLQSIFNYKSAVFDLMDTVGVDHFSQ